jgi:predicted nucleotidyltransferase
MLAIVSAMERDAIENAVRGALLDDGRIRWAYAFGSFARGEPFRDVDIAVMLVPDASWSALELGRLRLRLEGVCGHPVDVVDLSHARLPLLGSILRERRVLLDRATDERHAWEASTASRWLDFEPAWRHQSAIRREAMRARTGVTG